MKLNNNDIKSRLLLAELESKYFKDLTLKQFDESEISAVTLDDGSQAFSDLPKVSILGKYRIDIAKPPKSEPAVAICDWDKKVITLFRGRYEKHKEITLLHEMVHAYDHELVRYQTWRDYLLIYLYNKISDKLGKKRMHSILTLESHPGFCENMAHNLLFVLKSLDLDLMLKKKLGTVFAYGRAKYFG